MGAQVVGFKELKHTLRRWQQKAPVAMAFGMYEAMQNIMVVAKARAPKDTTAMARSGYVEPPMVRGDDVSINSGFGGLSAEYVVRQHEDTSLNHPNGGRAGFFSSAIDDGWHAAQRILARHVEQFLRRGRTTPVPKRVPASPWEDQPPGGKP